MQEEVEVGQICEPERKDKDFVSIPSGRSKSGVPRPIHLTLTTGSGSYLGGRR